jgi:hypothetical protein
MDNLPIWAAWIAAVAVGISPGLAILSAPAIARLLRRLLRLRPEVPPKPEREPRHTGPIPSQLDRGDSAVALTLNAVRCGDRRGGDRTGS